MLKILCHRQFRIRGCKHLTDKCESLHLLQWAVLGCIVLEFSCLHRVLPYSFLSYLHLSLVVSKFLTLIFADTRYLDSRCLAVAGVLSAEKVLGLGLLQVY